MQVPRLHLLLLHWKVPLSLHRRILLPMTLIFQLFHDSLVMEVACKTWACETWAWRRHRYIPPAILPVLLIPSIRQLDCKPNTLCPFCRRPKAKSISIYSDPLELQTTLLCHRYPSRAHHRDSFFPTRSHPYILVSQRSLLAQECLGQAIMFQR